MARFWVIVAYGVTYGFYALVWVVLGIVSFAGALNIWISGDNLDTSEVVWNGLVVVGFLGLVYFAAVGFGTKTREQRDALWDRWVEANPPSWDTSTPE